jgi:lipoprotein-anchoring transpeptidase ErfK/SrfK
MKKILIITAICLLSISIEAEEKVVEVKRPAFKKQSITIVPKSITEFEVTDKNGKTKLVNLKGKKFIVVSVSEPGSEGKSYAVDEDGLIWWQNKISSGAYGGHETPSGIYPVLLKRRYHMSSTHPSPDGINNMDFEMLFDNRGYALHLGNVRALSHGCIHIGRRDVEAMFKWVDTKTKVVIMRGYYGQFLKQEVKEYKGEIKGYKKSH